MHGRHSCSSNNSISVRSFEEHHTQRISLAAVMYDAMAIRKRLLSKKITKCAAHVAPPGSLPA